MKEKVKGFVFQQFSNCWRSSRGWHVTVDGVIYWCRCSTAVYSAGFIWQWNNQSCRKESQLIHKVIHISIQSKINLSEWCRQQCVFTDHLIHLTYAVKWLITVLRPYLFWTFFPMKLMNWVVWFQVWYLHSFKMHYAVLNMFLMTLNDN